jgi:GLPGLI family protein
MKNLFVLLFVLKSIILGYSQHDMYLVTYKMDTYGLKDTINKMYENEKISSTLKKINTIKKDIEFLLYFNTYSSSFILKEKIIPEGEELYYSMAALQGAAPGDNYYKNTQNKIKIMQTEASGEVFKVSFPFNQYEWKISNETKIINGYKCFKATTHWEENDYSREKTLQFDPIVWFTNDIPFSFGPLGLDGLPGLVLEASLNGKTFFYVSSLQSNLKEDRKQLEEPKKGKNITNDEFLKLLGTVKMR